MSLRRFWRRQCIKYVILKVIVIIVFEYNNLNLTRGRSKGQNFVDSIVIDNLRVFVTIRVELLGGGGGDLVELDLRHSPVPIFDSRIVEVLPTRFNGEILAEFLQGIGIERT